jgi:hypothetical protein
MHDIATAVTSPNIVNLGNNIAAVAAVTFSHVNLARDSCAAVPFESPTSKHHFLLWDNSPFQEIPMGACHGTYCLEADELAKPNAFTSAETTGTGSTCGGGDDGDFVDHHLLMQGGESDIEIFYDAVEFLDDLDNANNVHSSVIEISRGGSSNHGGASNSSSDTVALAFANNNHVHHQLHNNNNNPTRDMDPHSPQTPPPPPRAGTPNQSPPPPQELPLRFLRAGKGDPVEGQRRYEATLKWRAEQGMDTILTEANPYFELIKSHYPHFFHLRGRNNEPVYYETPAKINLKALRAGGVTIDSLLRHYSMVTEFMWQYVEGDDLARNIYVIDLEGIRLRDSLGEAVDFIKRAAIFTGAHYPERSSCTMLINVPSWFQVIWKVVKPLIDPATLKKVYILRGKDEICNAMQERIPIEHIPPEYGGTSMPLGQSPEEHMLSNLMKHNNDRANGCLQCEGMTGQPPCPYCIFRPWRSY